MTYQQELFFSSRGNSAGNNVIQEVWEMQNLKMIRGEIIMSRHGKLVEMIFANS